MAGFAQDKWRIEQPADAEPRRALRRRDHPDPGDRRSAGRRQLPGRQEQLPAARRRHLRPAAAGSSVIRGGYGRFFDKTHFELIGGLYTGTPFTSSFTRELPVGGGRSRPAQRPVPDRSDPGQRAGAQSRAARHSCSAAGSCCATPARAGTTRIARVPVHRSVHGRLRAAARRADCAVSADYVHAFSRDLLMSLDLNPGCARRPAVTSPHGAAGQRAA